MRFIAIRRIANYGGRSFEPGDTIEEIPDSNQRSFRYMIDLHWIAPVEDGPRRGRPPKGGET